MPTTKKSPSKKHIAVKSQPEKKVRKRRKIVLKAVPKPVGVVEMDEMLRRVNCVQTQRKNVTFKVMLTDVLVCDNILHDAGVVFKRANGKETATYSVSPGPKEEEGVHTLESLEELDDEFLEDGQIFR